MKEPKVQPRSTLQKNFKQWGISLVLVVMLIVMPSLGYTMNCEYVSSDGNRSERLMRCDGQLYFVFPEEKGRKLFEDIQKLESYKRELRLKDRKIKLLQKKQDLQEERVAFWKSEYQRERELTQTFVQDQNQSTSFWQSPTFYVLTGFVSASLIYAGWQYSYQAGR